MPDEESLSAGMRAAIGLLKEMKEKHGLNYILLLDSEPDKRMNGKPTITDGSVGKILPLFYVRGVQAHVGQIFYGINPLHILSEIISRTDSSADFCESSGNTITPPPSWLYGKDTKTVYDVTYPAAACGYMNLFMLEKTPEEHMKGLYDICLSAMTDVLKRRNENYACYLELQGRPRAELPYKPLVKTFREVYDEAKKDSGSAFEDAYKAAENSARKEISENRMTMFEASKLLIETALRYRHDLS
ncbi:hypothetical protein LJC34_08045, partial [Oscillospiraceae bacterium OttesenSCG-928-G22]|nr:hypothetical protein [Oscillospiraceae bacterium OttesenSCG-928-G22]